MFRVFRVFSRVRHGSSRAEKWTSISPCLGGVAAAQPSAFVRGDDDETRVWVIGLSRPEDEQVEEERPPLLAPPGPGPGPLRHEPNSKRSTPPPPVAAG